LRILRLTSRRNRNIQCLRRLCRRQHREKLGRNLVVLEGQHLVREALRRRIPVLWAVGDEAYWAKEEGQELMRQLAGEAPVYVAPPNLLQWACSTETSPGIAALARCECCSLADLSDARKVLVLDGVADPGNVGTLCRVAHAAGLDAVVSLRGTADAYNTKALRASAGSILWLKVAQRIPRDVFCRWARSSGLSIWAATARGGRPPWALELFRGGWALVLGHETTGVSEYVLQHSCGKVTVPMPGGVESLNVAAAGAMILYEWIRQLHGQRGEA